MIIHVTNGFGWFYGLSTIFHLYCGGHFHWWRKQEYPEKTTDMSQITPILHRMVVGYTTTHAIVHITTTGALIAATNKTNHHDITEILLNKLSILRWYLHTSP